jgi:hypothetical protein
MKERGEGKLRKGRMRWWKIRRSSRETIRKVQSRIREREEMR